MAVGRISGPLLKDNLLRNGVDLAFETNLLYLDVVNSRVGIKNASPQYDLDINGTTRTTNLYASTSSTIGTFTISGSTISSTNSTINLTPNGSSAVVYQGTADIGNLSLTGNTISATNTNGAINITANGSGVINLNSNVLVTGDLHATGNITADGNITLGNASTDTVTFDAEVASSIIPNQNNHYDLGSNSLAWANAYVNTVNTSSLTTSTITANGINLVLPQGNIIYVSTTGSDSNAGVHENNPFLTIAHALSVATSGTTVYVYPGTYSEIFPLTVPEGVTLRGTGIRAVIIQPTAGTKSNDAFLLNGETTLEDFTLTGFLYNSGANTGYGFRFANNFLTTTRSPYIRNLTIITRGSVTSSGDPYGFNQGDAGKGVFADGSVVNSASLRASMLFHGVTFFIPNQDAITATNGVRMEWVNSFTYFANRAVYLYSSTPGFAGAGRTKLRINSQIGTWAVGNTLTYYDTDGVTVLASGTISSISGQYVYINGRHLGFQTITDRPGKTVYAQGGANLSASVKKFGTASLALNGTTDYATIPTNVDFAFGSSAWTIEMWVYRTGNAGAIQYLADLRNTSTDVGLVVYLSATYVPIIAWGAGNTMVTGSAAVPLNTWTHIAIAKSGTSTKMFVNGTQSGSTYTDNNTYIQGPLVIGARYNATLPLGGYIDDLRIEKGVAKYTTNFTPSSVALTSDTNTVLMLHFDGTNGSTVFVDDGYTQQNLRTSAGGTASIINFADYSDFGVEMRIIGSAFSFGNYGIWGDGQGVKAYLVSHNFSYIGSGLLSTDDPSTQIVANEITQVNGAEIYYTAVDNAGQFNVGQYFSVNQKTGIVTFNGQALSITTATAVTFTDGVHTTSILPGEIDTGNIKISGNTIQSVTGDINVTAASGHINLQNNTYITGNLSVTGDTTIGGNITIGNQTSDTVNFVAGINSDLIPATTSAYDLGTSSLNWNNAYFNSAYIGNVTVNSNTISTASSNSDLQLVPNGTGRVYIPSNNVQVDQNVTISNNLTVTSGTTSLQAVGITGTLTQTGDFTQTSGNFSTTGTINSGAITSTGTLTLPDVTISGSTITGTTTATNLTLTPYSGKAVEITSDATLDGNTTVGGTLSVTGTSTLHAVGITGTLTQTGDFTQTSGNFSTTGTINSGAITSTGTLTLPDVTISGSTITGTTTATNLTLTPYSGQQVEITSDATLDGNTTVGGTLSVTGTSTLHAVGITGALTQTGDFTQTSGNFSTTGTINSGAITSTGTLTLPDVTISGSTITGTQSGTNLQIAAYSGQQVEITSNATLDGNATVGGTLSVTGTSTLHAVGITGALTQTGDFTQTGNFSTSGNVTVNGDLSVSGEWTIGNIIIAPPGSPSTITTSTTNSNLILTGNGTGSVVIEGLSVTSNTIASTITNSDITLTPQGTGSVIINSNQSLQVPAGTTLQEPSSPANGMIRYNTDHNRYEGYSNGYWTNLGGVQSVNGQTYITPESSPGAGNNVLSFYAGNTLTATIDSTKLYATNFETSQLSITGNNISALSSNTDINFTTSGSGGVQVGNLLFNGNSITNTATNAVTLFTNTSASNSSFQGTIASQPSNTFTGSISGNILTVSSPPGSLFGGSISFDGSTNYLNMSPGFGVGGIAYTIEFFFYTSSTGTQTILGAGAGGYSLSISSSSVDVQYVGGTTNSYAVSFATNTWNHLVIVRNSSLIETVFINGVRSTSGAITNNLNYGSNTTTIGASLSGTNLFSGELTNLRIVIGTSVYDPTTTTITVPTGPLTAVTGTAILLLASNSANDLIDTSNNETVSQAGSGNVSYSNLSPFGTSGTGLAVGDSLSGSGITPGTYIVSNISGTGTSSSSSWTININYVSAITNETVTSTPVLLTVTSVISGSVTIGNTISGSGITTGTIITAQVSGTTNGLGTYYVTPPQNVPYSTVVTEAAGSGYVQIGGSYGVVIPVGNTTNYPAFQYTETGMMRFNNDPNYMYVEIYNGTSWASVAGAASGVTTSQATDIALGIVLSLG